MSQYSLKNWSFKMFRDMKVGTRLTLAFGAVLVLLVAVIGVGLMRMAAIRTNLRTITDENIVAMRHATAMSAEAAQVSTSVRDALLGEFQTVIKPLGKLFRKADCVSGSSILGNGEVALILDVPTLVQQARAQEQQRAAVAANA